MKTRKPSARIALGIGIFAVLVGIGWWRHSQLVEQQRTHITRVSAMKRIGLSYRVHRNDIARFTLQGPVQDPTQRIEQ